MNWVQPGKPGQERRSHLEERDRQPQQKRQTPGQRAGKWARRRQRALRVKESLGRDAMTVSTERATQVAWWAECARRTKASSVRGTGPTGKSQKRGLVAG